MLLLEPGVITKTSGGKIKYQTNIKGVLAILPENPKTESDKSDIVPMVTKLFKKIDKPTTLANLVEWLDSTEI